MNKQFIFTFIFFTFVLLIPQILQAQTLKYSYDASGNRIKREVLAVKTSMSFEVDSITNPTEGTDSLLVNESPDNSSKINIGDAFPTIIYPNPTLGQISLELPALKAGEKGYIQIFSEMGKMIMNQGYVSSNQYFDLSFVPQGFYILRICIGNQVVIKKVIKQ